MDKKDINTVFLDYDGTLHNSMHIYKPAFLKAFDWLVKENYMTDRSFKDEDISQYLGQSPKEMWDNFGPDLPENIKKQASKLLGDTMKALIDNKEAQLFDGALETLSYLKSQGYTLVFISNCTNQYMETHTEIFGLDQYFDQMVNAEMYDYQPKEVILQKIMPNFNDDMVIIGDRKHDIKAGKDNNIYTIACMYGFGDEDELKIADYSINDIKDLKSLL